MIYYSTETKQVISNRIEAHRRPEPYYFYWHDHILSKVDWSIEPKESLPILYRNRAQQLRDTYDYLILAFSGGADSTNVLETFFYNNIHLDEILIVGAFSQDPNSDSDDNHNKELYYNAFPLLRQIELRNTKITVKDYTKSFDKVEKLSIIKDYGSEWVYNIGSYLSPHNWWWRDVHYMYHGDKKTALIFGIEKPILRTEGDKFVYKVYDIWFNQYGNFQEYENVSRVNFYTSPDTIDLIKKQLHIVKRFFIENCQKKHLIEVAKFWEKYDSFIIPLVYDLKHPILFRSPKSPSQYFSLRDKFLLDKKDTEIYKIYLDGIKNIKDVITTSEKQFFFHTRSYYI